MDLFRKKQNILSFSYFFILMIISVLGGIVGGGIYSSMEESGAETDNYLLINEFGSKYKKDSTVKTRAVDSQIFQEVRRSIAELYIQNDEKFLASKGPSFYLENERVGAAVVLTVDGWFVGKYNQNFAAKSKLSLHIGNQSYPVIHKINDPSTGLIFFKVDADNLSPIEFSNQPYALGGTYYLLSRNSIHELPLSSFSNDHLYGVTGSYNLSSDVFSQRLNFKTSLRDKIEGFPVVDERGDFVAIVGEKDSHQVMGVPTGFFENILKSIFVNKELDRLKLGINYYQLSDLIGNRSDYKEGAYILSLKKVLKYGENVKKDDYLRKGDVVVKIEGEFVDRENNLNILLQDYKKGDLVNLIISRDNKLKEVQVLL